jgi:iron complex outermembrane recepter protein
VEVLRGPQGTLFGRNTLAGAIQYVTRAPSTDFGGDITATVGDLDRRGIEGAINIPLGDTLSVRLAGIKSERGGYIRDLRNGIDRGAEDTTAGRLRVRWTPTSKLTVDVKGEVVNQTTNGRAVLVTAVNPNAQFPAVAGLFGVDLSTFSSFISRDDESFGGFNQPDYFRFNFTAGQANVTYDVSDAITLKSITAVQAYRPRQAQDFDNTPLDILWLSPTIDNSESFSQELQLLGRGAGGRLSYTLGAYYFDFDQSKNPNVRTKVGPLPPVDAFGNPRNQIQSTAIYGRLGYDLTERLTVDLGLRYTNEKTTSELIGETRPISQTFRDWSPYVGLNYKASDDVFAYAKVSKGFRAGGFTANRELLNGGNPFSPEEAWTYETGLRMEFPDAGLRINPTAYFTKWTDIQFNQLIVGVTGNPAVTTRNAGDAEIQGLELEALWAPTDKLEFNATVALQDSKYTRVADIFTATFPTGWSLVPTGAPPPAPPVAPVPNSVVPVRNITLDHRLQRAPELTYTIGARYEQPLAEYGTVVGSLSYAWMDQQGSSVTIVDQVLLPSYGLLNGRLQFNAQSDRWSVALYGTNLTDEQWLIGGIGFDTGFTVGTRELDPGRPREVGVELKVNF